MVQVQVEASQDAVAQPARGGQRGPDSHIYISIHIYAHICAYLYIHIHAGVIQHVVHVSVLIHIICIYIYIYMYVTYTFTPEPAGPRAPRQELLHRQEAQLLRGVRLQKELLDRSKTRDARRWHASNTQTPGSIPKVEPQFWILMLVWRRLKNPKVDLLLGSAQESAHDSPSSCLRTCRRRFDERSSASNSLISFLTEAAEPRSPSLVSSARGLGESDQIQALQGIFLTGAQKPNHHS